METTRNRSTIVNSTTEYDIPMINFKVALSLTLIATLNCVLIPMYVASLGFDYRFIVLVLNSLLIPAYLTMTFKSRFPKVKMKALFFIVMMFCLMLITYLWLYAFVYA